MAVNVDDSFRLAASWINCILFVLEIFLMNWYFRLPSKPLFHRISVGAILAFDTVCTFAIYIRVYLVVLVIPCQSHGLFVRSSLQTLAVIIFTTYSTASIEQLFLCYLYFTLTQRRVITGFFVFSVAVHLAFNYLSAILILVNNSPQGWAFLSSKIGAISCAVTDIMIASALTYSFIRIERNLVVRVSTRSRLRRLMVLTFSSGVIVASVTLLVMILLIKANPAYSLFFYAQGRIYALTTLCNYLAGVPNKSTEPFPTNPPGSIITAVVFHNDTDPSIDDWSIPTRDVVEPGETRSHCNVSLGSTAEPGLRFSHDVDDSEALAAPAKTLLATKKGLESSRAGQKALGILWGLLVLFLRPGPDVDLLAEDDQLGALDATTKA
ncbi:hypothetical protein B0H12DRAFT_1326430 [Mycena haematopus]|nr:hypothetical protein B0H12DRAFT_1326430 [Mycena haematopus]